MKFLFDKREKSKDSVDSFFKKKHKLYFQNKKPKAVNYTYKTHDPYHIFGENSGYEKLYLIGDNWLSSDKPIVLLWGFNDWKLGFVSDYLPEFRTAFVPRKMLSINLFNLFNSLKFKADVFIVWGYTEPYVLRQYARFKKTPIWRMEDGFIRSAELGAAHSTPYSLVLDKTGFYYNSHQSSDLEDILNTYDFKNNKELLINAKKCMQTIIDLKLSKYNPPQFSAEGVSRLIKTRKRVAILGQVDSDASIKYGNPDGWTAESLVRLARYENPEAEVLYRPHPEVFKGYQKSKFKNKKIEKIAKVVSPDEPFIDFIESVDHVYTISSLSGFEALIRNIKVTTVGAPFYSGWGLTDDRVYIERRKARLSLDELFAAAYILYPRYLADIKDSTIGLTSSAYKISADRFVLNYKHSIKSDSFEAAGSSNLTYFINKIFLGDLLVEEYINKVNFSSLFLGGSDYSNKIICFMLLGKLTKDSLRDIFLKKIRVYIDTKLFNEILLCLAGGSLKVYLIHHFEWLISATSSYRNSGEYLSSIKELGKLRSDDVVLYDNDHIGLSISAINNFLTDRRIDDALKLLNNALLSGFESEKLLRISIFIAEINFDFLAVKKLSHFYQMISLYDSNKVAVMHELKADKYCPVISKHNKMELMAKVVSLKPDQIMGVVFHMNVFPEIFDLKFDSQVIYSLLNMDGSKSTSKVQALIGLEKFKKAQTLMEELVEGGLNGDKDRVLYSQVLSYNGNIDKAKKIMALTRSQRMSSLILRESLRLCVLDGDYKESLSYVEIAEKNKIYLGDMHLRKAFFGNRMLKEAFETFCDIRIIKAVSKYYNDKYYDESDEGIKDLSVFLLAVFGPGDELRFASIYNMLGSVLNTNDISIACSPRLFDIFSRSFPLLSFISVDRPRNTEIDLDNYLSVPGFDIISVVDDNAVAQINKSERILFVTDLLHKCLPTYESFPGTPYLFANEDLIAKYKLMLPQEKILVGLSWRSSLTTHSRNEHYLLLEQLAPLFEIEGIQFVNLQYDNCDEELVWAEQKFPGKIINIASLDQYNDFDGVAALMKCLDLIVSPATTVVELAGALGCQTWLLSNSTEINWRKINSTGTDVWHKNTTIIEGSLLGNKESLVDSLFKRLADFSAQGTKKSA
jgi:capsular polysaccharide export protein